MSDFDSWASSAPASPQLSGRVKRVLTLASGGSRTVRVDLADTTRPGARGHRHARPAGGLHRRRREQAVLPGGRRTRLGDASPSATPTRPCRPRTRAAPTATTTTRSHTTAQGAAPDVSDAALELVPATTIPQAGTAPAVDGKEASGEYPGPSLDLSRLWEGDACASAADCSATGKVAWYDDALYVLVQVKDDKRGQRRWTRPTANGTGAPTRWRSASTRAATPRTPRRRSRPASCPSPPAAARASNATPTTTRARAPRPRPGM